MMKLRNTASTPRARRWCARSTCWTSGSVSRRWACLTSRLSGSHTTRQEQRSSTGNQDGALGVAEERPQDALRQVPGIPLDAGEVFEEAAAMGIKVEPLPNGAEPSTDQAILMVNQAIRDAQNNGPDWEASKVRLPRTWSGGRTPFEMTAKAAVDWAMEYAPPGMAHRRARDHHS